MALPSVYETPRECARCGVTYTPERPKDPGRRGTYSEFCSKQCALRGVQQASTDFNTARKAARADQIEYGIQPTKSRKPRTRSVVPPKRKPASTYSPLAQNLRRLRAKHRLLAEEMAEKLGVSVNTLKNWETDKTDVTAKNLARLAKLFGLTMDQLWNEVTSGS